MGADLLVMLKNMSASFPAIVVTITYGATIIGVWIIGDTLLQIYHESRTDGGQMTAGKIAGRIMIGIVLTMPMFMVQIVGNTALPDVSSGPFTYSAIGSSEEQKAAVKAVFLFFSLVGYIAFVRGWIIADKHIKGVVQDGAWTAFWHIVGGVALIFIEQSLKLLADWTGFDFVGLMFF